MKNAQGFALLLVLVGITAALTMGALAGRRIDADLLAARADEERVQALWLARSAAALQQAGDREVEVRGGRAKVHVAVSAGPERSVEATVTTASGAVAQASARLSAGGGATGWVERFERFERGGPAAESGR